VILGGLICIVLHRIALDASAVLLLHTYALTPPPSLSRWGATAGLFHVAGASWPAS